MKIRTASLACIGLLGLPLASLAQDQGPFTAHQQMLVRDAKTGRMRAPTAAELNKLLPNRPATNLDTTRGVVSDRLNLQTKRDASGAVGVQSSDDLASYAVVKRQADGKLVEACVESKHEAEKLVQNGALPAAPKQAPSK